jgi:DNA-binding NarL/FixJ family response regulator
MIRVAVADDHTLFKSGIIELIQSQPDMEVLFDASNGQEFIENLATNKEIDIAVIDIEMPVMNGFDLTSYLHEKFPTIKVIVLSAYSQERFVVKLIECGAAGFLSKNCDPKELFDAIRQTKDCGFYLTPEAFKVMQRARTISKKYKNINNIPVELTARELEVLKLICREMTNHEIGDELSVSVRTIEGHRNNLILKTGSRNTAGLVLFAVRYNIIDALA